MTAANSASFGFIFPDAENRIRLGTLHKLRHHRFERIPKEDQEVDRPFSDLRSDLLVAPKRSALKLDDWNLQFFLEQTSRCSGCKQFMAGEQYLIEAHPVKQVYLLVGLR